MKRIYIIFISTLLMFIIILCDIYNRNIIENGVVDASKNQLLSMMIETGVNSGMYEESKNSLWPQDGYEFNSQLSKCENGSILTWNAATKSVKINSNVSDKCYVYFDEVSLLADHIRGLYTSQGVGGLYLHDSTLANGAGDNSYRYAGANPNNYVCFGTDVTPCPNDNLYRIIGVFGDQVKLIKYDYANSNLLGTDGDYDSATYSASSYSRYKGQHTTINNYYWNNSNESNSLNNWNESKLNIVNLNTNFINKLGVTWANKIATTTWKVGGNTSANIEAATASNTYKNEIITPAVNTTYNAKIGLMYVSDYGFAADASAWMTTISDYNINNIPLINWMYMGLFEWTITRYSNSVKAVVLIHGNGDIHDTPPFTRAVNFDSINVYYSYSIRPVFYLTPSVTYVSGTGTQNDPILIN